MDGGDDRFGALGQSAVATSASQTCAPDLGSRLGHERTADATREAIASGRVDHYLSKPTKVADESFHRAMSGFLWQEHAKNKHGVTVTRQQALGPAERE
jgi:hypothetical protein